MTRKPHEHWYALSGGVVSTTIGPDWAAHIVVDAKSNALAIQIAQAHNCIWAVALLIKSAQALAERLESYREWHEAAIPASDRDDYERDYLLAGSAKILRRAGQDVAKVETEARDLLGRDGQ